MDVRPAPVKQPFSSAFIKKKREGSSSAASNPSHFRYSSHLQGRSPRPRSKIAVPEASPDEVHPDSHFGYVIESHTWDPAATNSVSAKSAATAISQRSPGAGRAPPTGFSQSLRLEEQQSQRRL